MAVLQARRRGSSNLVSYCHRGRCQVPWEEITNVAGVCNASLLSWSPERHEAELFELERCYLSA